MPSKFSKGLEAQSESMQNYMRKLVFIITQDKHLFDVLNGSNEGIELYFRKLIFSTTSTT